MSASEHLNKPLFHGTNRKFKAGDIILPRSQTGASPNWVPKVVKNDRSLAYATDDMKDAKAYSRSAHSVDLGETSTSKPRVYQVEPVNPDSARWEEKSLNWGRDILRQHVSSEGYRVVKRVWTGR